MLSLQATNPYALLIYEIAVLIRT